MICAAMDCREKAEINGYCGDHRSGGYGPIGGVQARPPFDPACATCKDTHRMTLIDREVPCTHCPVPCPKCGLDRGSGAYCSITPCACECHCRPNKPQPPPKRGVATPTADLVLADILERKAMGRAKYGVEHQADNGRDHLVDAYQEALDLVIYLRAEISKRGGA